MIENVAFRMTKETENESTTFITNLLQNKLSSFANDFNEQHGTLIINVIAPGRFRYEFESITDELRAKIEA